MERIREREQLEVGDHSCGDFSAELGKGMVGGNPLR